ncbi:hypothetical protein TRFO_24360 [Tritrichomonas foetus]|uniref:Uncharacterized protein n=1 Tax=Tritrichomonas foetus TaxID=1144522 RepID=A0A1J4K8Z3_9EUKA|nr:hypothetical protein TRFO_24360 [Tritrichomonas foetus]|eukprot:OHT07410.1 hypothetical protein TRFO_24360 [Tritrichomonas foetus]
MRAVGIKTNVPGTSLFDFDVQVQPMVTALVQKALTQAAMEYQEEEELAYMQMYLKAFQHTAQKEGEAIKRLEEAELKKYEEKEEIIKKKLQIEEAQLELRSKVMARGFAEWFIWDIQNDVMESLHQRGYFYDEVERDIEQTFLPWLTQVVEAEIAKPSVPFAIVDKVVEIAVDLCNQQSNQSAIDIQIEEDQKEIKRNKLLRLMIAEDIVAQKMRQAKKMGKLKKQKKNGDDDGNEEEEEDNDSNAPTESTNESSDY